MRYVLVLGVVASSSAFAASIPFTGTLGDGFDMHALFLSGPGFLFQSVQNEGANLWNCSGSCNLSETFDATGSLFSGYVASYNGQTVSGGGTQANGTVGGHLSLEVPSFPLSECGTAAFPYGCPTLPVAFSGDLFARFRDGTLLFDFPVSGTGTVTPEPLARFVGINAINARLTGSADPTPEPAAWILLATALPLLGGLKRLMTKR